MTVSGGITSSEFIWFSPWDSVDCNSVDSPCSLNLPGRSLTDVSSCWSPIWFRPFCSYISYRAQCMNACLLLFRHKLLSFVKELGIDISELEGVKDTTRRPAEWANLGSWGLTEPGLPTRRHPGAGPRPPHTFGVDVQLGLHLGPLTSGAGAVSVSVPCHWSVWLGLSGRGYT